MSKYQTLLTILDKIRQEAPLGYKRYSPPENKIEELNNARARAFIHLFLKVKFGILDFTERENYITDDPQDGGIDGYFIDNNERVIYLLQSKFRTTEQNFCEREILFTDLLQMDVNRISGGEEIDDNGNPYNGKIKKLIFLIRQIPDIGRWSYHVIILANLKSHIKQQQLQRLSGGNITTVYDYNRVYSELVFPVVQGTYYSSRELKITFNLSNASSQNADVTYRVTTQKNECDITLVFVPTIEIAQAMHKFRNSILQFNPRSYLELKNNEVNRAIEESILKLSTNEFSLFNNGITLLSYGTDLNRRIGQKDKAQLIINQPQIINGGQTAYTLSRIYEDYVLHGLRPDVFENKEVLLKIITIHSEGDNAQQEFLELIEAISKATNQQSQVNEADRRSNDAIQIQLQEFLFNKYGYFYERKRGEYADGIRAGYIPRSQVIDRELFIRICKCCDMEPSDAKRMSLEQLFDKDEFDSTLRDPNRFDEYYFAYRCLLQIKQIKTTFIRDKQNKFGILNYGFGLQFGVYAVVSACCLYAKPSNYTIDPITAVDSILEKWTKFEQFAVGLPDNSDYFRFYSEAETGYTKQELNFNNYYKGKTLAANLQVFFRELAK